MSEFSPAALAQDLELLAARTASGLVRLRMKRALVAAAPRVAAACVALPLVGFLLALAGSEPRPLAWTLRTLAVVLLLVVAAIQRAWVRRVDRAEALSTVDRRLSLEGRLTAADEFLRTRAAGPFHQAALADAAQHTRGALAVDLFHGRAGRPSATLLVGPFAGAVLVLLLALHPSAASGPLGPGGDPDLAELVADAPEAREGEALEEGTPPAAEPTPTPEPEERPARPREEREATPDRPGELSEQAKESAGKSSQGRSAEATSQSAASASKGNPSDQAQPSQEPKERAKDPKKPEAKAPKPPKESDRKPPEESGATTGSGASKGSGKNPTASEWTTKDQVTTPDDTEIEEDDEADDEEEEQESRGGLQPSLRDRRPPVSRDLRIGFGNRPNPDANGRGGPSEPKKSRGVASLVLGVPIPDRVKGQPGPGRTKVTQERIQPEAEETADVNATARRPRNLPEGSLSALDLEPWLQGVVTRYFLGLRRAPVTKP